MKQLYNLYKTIKKIPAKISGANIPAYSGQAAFFLFISAFPFIMLLLTFIKFSPLSQELLMSYVNDLTPVVIKPTVTSWVNELYLDNVAAIFFSSAVTLWSASKGIFVITNSINKLINNSSANGTVKKGKGYIFNKLLSFLYTIILILIIILGLILITISDKFGDWLVGLFPQVGYIAAILNFRIIIALLMFFVLFTLLFSFVPYPRCKIKYAVPGALLSTLGCFLYSWIYSVYVNIAHPGVSIYGSFTAVILLLLWLYFCLYIIFCGALLISFYSKK